MLLGWVGVIALVFLVARGLNRSALGWSTLFAWLSLPAYNTLLLSNCPGDCGIRVDLLVVGPVVLTLTVIWVAQIWRGRNGGKSNRGRD